MYKKDCGFMKNNEMQKKGEKMNEFLEIEFETQNLESTRPS